MSDDLIHEAIERKHSAFSEVLQIIRKCKPKFTVLTHFSQRLAKGIDPDMQSALEKSGLPARLAVDFLQIPFG